jgi:serine/threonine-protein kinase
MLFEVVTGRRMWTGNTDLELLRQLALADPPKLADAAPDAPREIHDLHARLVAKKPKQRPATAHEVAEALRTFAPDAGVARARLAHLLEAHYAAQARSKRDELEAALVRHSTPPDGDARSGEPGAVIGPATAARPSRMAPWAYALVGAAVASVAVLGFSRFRPTEPSVTTASSAASQTPAQVVTVTAGPSVASSASPSLALPQPTRGPRGRSPLPVHSSAPASSTAAPTAPPLHPPIDVDPHAI